MALRRISSTITTNSPYRNGQLTPDVQWTFTITFSEALPSGLSPQIRIVDTGRADQFSPGFGFRPILISGYGLTKANDTTWRLTYTPSRRGTTPVSIPSVSISVEDYYYDTVANTYQLLYQNLRFNETTHQYENSEGDEVFGTSSALGVFYQPPPARLEIHADTAFLANGETTSVTIYWNYSAQTITQADVIVDEGTVTNLSGSGNVYTFDLTAPSTGAGVIEANIDGFDAIKRFFAYAPPPDLDLYVPSLKTTPPHLPAADETLYVTAVGVDDLDDKNDFTVIIPFDKNVNGLTESDIAVEAVDSNGDSQDVSIQDFEGQNSVYELTVRPPSVGGQGTVTISIPEDAVNEGNPNKGFAVEYSDDISIPEWEVLFTTTEIYLDIVSVSRDGVELLRTDQIDFFDFDGTINATKQVNLPNSSGIVRAVKYDIDKYIGLSNATDATAHLFVDGGEAWVSAGIWKCGIYSASDWAWTRDRRLIITATPPAGPNFCVLPTREVHQAIRENYDLNDAVFDDFSLNSGDIEESRDENVAIAHGDGKLFVASNETSGQNYISVYDADNNLLSGQRIPIEGKAASLFFSDGYLYRYDDTSTSKVLMRFPLSALELPTAHKTVYPQLVRPGDEIDLNKILKYAEQITYDVGFDKPEWLSLESKKLKIADDVMSKSTAYVKLRGINYVGDTEKNTFGFYVYVQEVRRPQWRDFESLSMYPNMELNMFAYCENADTLDWLHGFTIPSHLEMTDGVISVMGTFPETATEIKLRARSIEGYYEDYVFDLFVIEQDEGYPANTPPRYKVEIEGVDITSYLGEGGVGFSNSLDLIRINRYTVADCNIPLNNEVGYFRSDLPDNFWDTNDLNPNGILNNVKVFVEFLDAGSWEPVLFFEGQITGMEDPLLDVSTLQCFSNTTRLTQIELEGAGIGIEKIAQLDTGDPERTLPVVEVTYQPESGMTPLTAGSAEAYHHQDCLNLKDVVNDALGIKDNSGFLSPADLKTQGGTLDDPLLINFKTAWRYQKVRSAFEKLTKIDAYLTSLFPDFEDLPMVEPHISVRGNIQFNTEAGRITRLPVDWILDEATNRLYVLLSNPSSHIADQLVEYRLDTDSYHVLRAFDPSDAVYRLSSSDYDTFYILCGTSSEIDRSDPLSEDTEAFTRSFDSSEEASGIKVMQYDREDDWLDTFIESDDDYRPQLGIHYHFGFPNRDYAWTGIVPSRQSAFLVQSSELHYRYATATAFGVARTGVDGITESLLTADKDTYDNHLNFAFCLDADDNAYFAYTQGTLTNSTLHIEMFDGTHTVVLASIERGISELTDLEDTGGAFLGVHEMVFLDDYLYMVVPIARGNRDIDKSAGSVLYRYGVYAKTLEKLDSADFVHFGFAGLTAHSETGDTPHDNAVYYAQSPAEVYKYPAYNPDISSYDTETSENYLPDFKGLLKRVLPTAKVEDCGAIRFDAEGAFRGLVCRPLSTDDTLHLMVAQGDPDTVLQKESTTRLPSSVLWCAFGRKLNFVLNAIPTSGSLDSALTNIASQANATFGIDRHITTIQNRSAVGALVKEFITENDISLDYDNANRATLPDSGNVIVDGEIIAFSGRSETQLTGIRRGRAHTTAAVHVPDTPITFLDKVIHPNNLQGNIFWSVDRTHLYNTIKDRNRLIKITDALSPFSEKLLNLELDWDNLHIPTIAFIAGDYLHRFKDVRFLLNLTVAPSFYLKIGDAVGFHYSAPIPPIAMQIMRINYTQTGTQITGRQTAPHIMAVADPVEIDPDETFRVLDGTGDPILVDGMDDHTIFSGDKFDPLPTQITFDSVIEDVTWAQFDQIDSEIMPEAFGGAGEFEYFMEGLPEGVFFDPKTRRRYGASEDSQSAREAIYTAIDKNGTPHRAVFEITVSAAPRPSRRILDGAGNPILVDGLGDHTIFSG